MLEKDRFLAIKKLAQDIRKENEDLFSAFAMESPEDAIREKEEFVEDIIDSRGITFSNDNLGREERQIFRANLLIPDDKEFFDTYSKDKNIRNLMNTYGVGIEDVMSKITELNIYADYLNDMGNDSQDEESTTNTENQEIPAEAEKQDDFVDAMVNLSSKEAESLLDEIENLSSAMDDLNITSVKEDEKNVIEESEVKESESMEMKSVTSEDKVMQPEVIENNPDTTIDDMSYTSDMSIEDISQAVDGFVNDFNNIQADLDNTKEELKHAKENQNELRQQVRTLREEAYSLKKNNLESAKSLKEAREANERLENENLTLKEQIRTMEINLKRSAEMQKKIYNSIPKK